jgi:hypothetical protein
MNERIRKLVKQAELPLLDVDGKCKYGDTYFSTEKFAELIVRECTDNIAGNIDLINPESSYNYGLRRAMNSVKEHFGVEE